MKQTHRRHNWVINHNLTPLFELPAAAQQRKVSVDLEMDDNIRRIRPNYKANDAHHPARSRKHRLAEERNTEIQKGNRMLYERIRKIKIKNKYQGDSPEAETSQNAPISERIIRPVSLPPIADERSLRSTRSELTSILSDTKSFAERYFRQIKQMQDQNILKSQQLGLFLCFGWQIKVLLLDQESIVLIGRKGVKQKTKKYIYERVRSKIGSDLEAWVRSKFQFEV